ncbi:hypothetical protein JRQ81_003804 [Phrynocephalus forsythii]|uniref:Uncharacterized protein n=1 Tax=Phrynocephalus forsythii TaxID=171643 RepID=A0A9Q1AXA0_9SAUR|nr:hypothetical protein JRQ81_003804 [Phrynocephalus forsythii]
MRRMPALGAKNRTVRAAAPMPTQSLATVPGVALWLKPMPSCRSSKTSSLAWKNKEESKELAVQRDLVMEGPVCPQRNKESIYHRKGREGLPRSDAQCLM